MTRLECLVLLAGDGNFKAVINRCNERTSAVEKRDLVLLEQIQNTVVVLFHHRIFATNHGRNIHGQAFHTDAMLSKMVRRLLVVLGRLQQGLRWDATNVGAGATGRGPTIRIGPLVNTSDLEA